jgi:phage shock protein A
MVKMLIFEMQEQIGMAREGVAKAIAGEKKLEANLAKNRSEAATWHAQAEAAIGHGNEELGPQMPRS